MRQHIKGIVFTLICAFAFCCDVFAINIVKKIRIIDMPDIVSICNQYGIDKTTYLLYENGKHINQNDKTINKISTFEAVVAGSFVVHPFNKNLRIRVDKVDVASFNDKTAFVTKYTVDNGGNISNGIGLSYDSISFPVKIDKCYFTLSSFGKTEEGALLHFTITDNTSSNIVISKGQEHKLNNGARIKIIEAVYEVKPYMPKYSGPSARIEYISSNGDIKTCLVFKNHPNLDQKDIPVKIVLTDYEQKMSTSQYGYCEK